MTQEEADKFVESFGEAQERNAQQAQKEKENNLEQEKLKVQQQQLQLQQQQQNTNQQLVIGGLVLGSILVLSIAIYLLFKTFRKDKKKP